LESPGPKSYVEDVGQYTGFYSTDHHFWMPDRQVLFDAFRDRRPLLNLDLWMDELENSRHVLTAFDLNTSLLSNSVEEDRVFDREPIYGKRFTDRLRAKSWFII
jgi:hypothetical protein